MGPLQEALAGGDVASFQLRLKEVSDDEIRRATDILRPVVQAAGAAFILNDRPDLAAELGCGTGCMSAGRKTPPMTRRAPRCRAALSASPAMTAGIWRMEAGEAGADYVAFGAFFPTQTKDPKTQADIELLRWWGEMMVVPCVAIGGITIANAPALIQAGADFLAVSAGVWEYSDGPRDAVRQFNTLFA